MISQFPIKRRKISEEVADRLEVLIHESRLEVGDTLPSEREVMEAFGVGRSAVREAIFSLSKRGLVEVRNGERARVASPDVGLLMGEMSGAARRMLMQPDGVRHFQDARRIFETGVAARAAERASPIGVDKLAEALERNRQAIGSQPAFEETDFLFHRQIAVIADNPIFLAATEALVTWLLDQRRRTVQGAEQATIAYEAHRQIFAAISARDSEGASAAMDSHLLMVERIYWDALP